MKAARKLVLASSGPRSRVPLPRLRYTASPAFSTSALNRSGVFDVLDTFQDRHIGPNSDEAAVMLKKLGYSSMDEFVQAAVPQHIRISPSSLSDDVIPPLGETEMIKRARQLANMNKLHRSYIGMGYHNAVVPKVIQRNVSIDPSFLFDKRNVCVSLRSWRVPLGTPNTHLISPRLLKVRLRQFPVCRQD